MTYTGKVEDITQYGQGVIRCDGKAIFVSGAALGDTVEYELTVDKGNYGLGKITQTLEKAAHSCAPKCAHFGTCGGCQLQNISYAAQKQFKENLVKQALTRIGGIQAPPVLPLVGSPQEYHYRNKAQIPFGSLNGQVTLGFFAPNSHDIVDMRECPLHHPDMITVALAVKKFIQDKTIPIYDEKAHSGVIRHCIVRSSDYMKELLVGIVANTKEAPWSKALAAELKKLALSEYKVASVVINVNTKKTNKIIDEKILNAAGEGFITEKIGGHFYKVSLNTFLQVNRQQAEAAYQLLEDRLLPGKKVLDLYCGVGTITLQVAKKSAAVLGIEENTTAIKDAKRNALNNNITNVTFTAGQAERQDIKGFEPSVIIVDPPRKGLEEHLLAQMLETAPEQILYMSCNPATLARDIKILSEKYDLVDVTPFDFFPQTGHVEAVAELRRK